MRFATRGRSNAEAAGLLTVRSHRDFRVLLDRVEEGALVVLDRRDLDATSARRLAARKPFAVLNAAEFVSGRFASLGPEVLTEAGIVLLEGEPDRVRALRDGTVLRLDGSTLYDGGRVAVEAHLVTADEIRDRMERARGGMTAQLDTFAHTASEFLRREEGVLLNGTGLPALRTQLAGRSVVVVGPQATAADVRRLSRFVREQRPVLIGVGAGADLLVRGRRRPDVLVIGRDSTPDDRALRRAQEVVLHEASEAVRRRVEKLNMPSHTVTTSATSTDVALLLAHAGSARLVVPVGDPATLEELIDRGRGDQASTVLTRMRLGNTVVEGAAVPLLYTGRVRIWQVLVLLLVALAVLGFTVAATPVGNDWWHDVGDWLRDLVGAGS